MRPRRERTVANGSDVHVDDIVPVTTPVQQMDLVKMFERVPGHRRPYVALAFLDLTFSYWCSEAGIERQTVYDWMNRRHQMPLGGAQRLARVLGLRVEELFGDS